MSLLIQNGRVITASDDYVADVYCENGTVAAIAKDLPAHRFQADRTIDARGHYVMPGGIDVRLTAKRFPRRGPAEPGNGQGWVMKISLPSLRHENRWQGRGNSNSFATASET